MRLPDSMSSVGVRLLLAGLLFAGCRCYTAAGITCNETFSCPSGFVCNPSNICAASCPAGYAQCGRLCCLGDAGTALDAGSDAGPSSMDAGQGTDAGLDAGFDAGPSTIDAGEDAGHVDAGPSAMDAGEDAGATATDAGVDAGIADAGFCPGTACACNGVNICASDAGSLQCIADDLWTATAAASDVPQTSQYAVTCPDTASDCLVTDSVTGLVWQQTISTGTYNWAASQAYCSGLSYGGAATSTGWRLPSWVELLSIVSFNANPASPMINGTVFPNTPANVFWTSTSFEPQQSGYAWDVIFSAGVANGSDTVTSSAVTDSYNVRCVR